MPTKPTVAENVEPIKKAMARPTAIDLRHMRALAAKYSRIVISTISTPTTRNCR